MNKLRIKTPVTDYADENAREARRIPALLVAEAIGFNAVQFDLRVKRLLSAS
jgi:hypothetical protein